MPRSFEEIWPVTVFTIVAIFCSSLLALRFFGDLDGDFRSLGSGLLAPALADILGEGRVLAHR